MGSFGKSVDIAANLAIVGHVRTSQGNGVCIYKWTGSSWVLIGTLVSPKGVTDYEYGNCVAIGSGWVGNLDVGGPGLTETAANIVIGGATVDTAMAYIYRVADITGG